MTTITEGNLTFSFENGCQASKYDEWSFYKKQFQNVAGGSKGVDILCVESDTSWLIEIKDYREHERKKPTDLLEEVAKKVRDTLAGLAAAAKETNGNNADERDLAKKALATKRWRIVLHLEQRRELNMFKPVSLSQSLGTYRLLKGIDPQPIVYDRNQTNNDDGIPWKVQ